MKKKQKQTKNRAKINEKNTHEKKGSLTLHKYCRQKKKKKKESNGIDSVQPQKVMSIYFNRLPNALHYKPRLVLDFLPHISLWFVL